MNLADRMKDYENREDRRLIPLLPTLARMDGRAFHALTKKMERPYDKRFSDCMKTTMLQLAQETHALVGYTQSDEISLLWHHEDHKSQMFFNGRVIKMISALASLATIYFYKALMTIYPEYADRCPTFDARVWQVPTKAEAVNALLWREQDAVRNSINMASQYYYSHGELLHKSNAEKQELLFQKGVNWNDYPAFFKRGTYGHRVVLERILTQEEASKFPEYYNGELVKRASYEIWPLPPLGSIENRVDVIFENAEPKYEG